MSPLYEYGELASHGKAKSEDLAKVTLSLSVISRLLVEYLRVSVPRVTNIQAWNLELCSGDFYYSFRPAVSSHLNGDLGMYCSTLSFSFSISPPPPLTHTVSIKN